MCRKGESIFLRGDGRYEARYIKEYSNTGRAVYGYVYGKTYIECKKKRNEKLINLKEEKINKKNNFSNRNFNYLIDKWLDNKKKKIKISSYSRYLQLINTHIRGDIGKVKVNKLTAEVINDFLNKKLDKGRLDKRGGLSKNTVYDIALIIKQVLKENDILLNVMSVSKTIGRGKSMYSNDKKKLEDYLGSIKEYDAIGIMLSLLLGLRESEICGLKWKDIDLENKVIYIKRIISRVKSFDNKTKTKLVISTPKTEKSIRTLPIPDKIIDILYSLKKGMKQEYYVLTGNSRIMDPRTYYNHYKRILNKVGNLNYTYHDLRHTFATNCNELGIDVKTLMELLGHSNINTTMNIYVHSSLENKRSFINQL